VIVDYKTGRHGLDADDARGSQALALYAYAAQRVFRRPCHRVELHHLPSGTVAAHEHTDESLNRQVARAEDTARDIIAAEKATSDKLAFMINHTSGLICVGVTAERVAQLQLPQMVVHNTESHQTAFSVSVVFSTSASVCPPR